MGPGSSFLSSNTIWRSVQYRDVPRVLFCPRSRVPDHFAPVCPYLCKNDCPWMRCLAILNEYPSASYAVNLSPVGHVGTHTHTQHVPKFIHAGTGFFSRRKFWSTAASIHPEVMVIIPFVFFFICLCAHKVFFNSAHLHFLWRSFVSSDVLQVGVGQDVFSSSEN